MAPPEPRDVVETFGSRLKNVALLAPEDDTRAAIRLEYAPLVTSSLLERWLAAPDEAPGRLTSSPWPDRIDIHEIDGSGNERMVFGDVVERTNRDADVARTPVALEMQQTANGWRISDWSAPGSAETAIAVLESYYAAIRRGDDEHAASLWGGQPNDTLRNRLANATSASVEAGPPGRIEGAAGSRYVEIPVEISAGTRLTGSYTLRRSVVDGATPEQQRWRIVATSPNGA